MEYPDRIEEFTKEQMMDYLVRYPKGLRVRALQRQLVQCLPRQEILDMLKESNPIIPQAILNARKEELERELHSVMRQSMDNTKADTMRQDNTTNNNVKKEEPKVVAVDNGDKTMEVIGKIFLSLLVIAGAFGIIYLVFYVLKVKQRSLIVPFWAVCVVPLLKSIWS